MTDSPLEICRACKKPIQPGSMIYTIGPEHWECHEKKQAEFTESCRKVDELIGRPNKKRRKRIGEGASAEKLKQIIVDSAREQFKLTDEDSCEVDLYLAPPVWRRRIYDVMRVEGTLVINGQKHPFGSWEKVTDLIKYRRISIDQHPAVWEVNPVEKTRRTRGRKENHK